TSNWLDLGVPKEYLDGRGTFEASISLVNGGSLVVVKSGGVKSATTNVYANSANGVLDGVKCDAVDGNNGLGLFYGIPRDGPGSGSGGFIGTVSVPSTTGISGPTGTNGLLPTDSNGLVPTGSNGLPVTTGTISGDRSVPTGWTTPPTTGFPVVVNGGGFINGTRVTSTVTGTGIGGATGTGVPITPPTNDDNGLTGWKLALAIVLPLLLLLCCCLGAVLLWKRKKAEKEKGTLPRQAPAFFGRKSETPSGSAGIPMGPYGAGPVNAAGGPGEDGPANWNDAGEFEADALGTAAGAVALGATGAGAAYAGAKKKHHVKMEKIVAERSIGDENGFIAGPTETYPAGPTSSGEGAVVAVGSVPAPVDSSDAVKTGALVGAGALLAGAAIASSEQSTKPVILTEEEVDEVIK
ncbi:hypothetical protein HDU99_007339, partial [Rhizoclosmatium hyalinum]